MKRLTVMLGAVLVAGLGCGDDPDQGSASNANGDDQTRTYEISFEDARLTNPRFSPDGQRLAANYNGDEYKLVVMDVDGTNMEILVEDVSYLTVPTWTGDGQAIIYNHSGGMHRVSVDGSEQETLFTVFSVPFASDLSPDGRYLIYATNGGTMAIMDLDQGDAPEDLGLAASTPRFSPDGQRVAYAQTREIGIMNADGSEQTTIVADEDDLSYLTSVAWLPDGEHLAFTSARGIEIVEVDSGERRTVADGFATMNVDVSSDGSRLAYAINGRAYLTVIENF